MLMDGRGMGQIEAALYSGWFWGLLAAGVFFLLAKPTPDPYGRRR